MSELAEDQLCEITESLIEYSEESVTSAIEAAKDPDVARQFIEYLEESLEDMGEADFAEIGLFIALSEAGAVEGIPVLLRAAVVDLFESTFYSDAAIYALQRMGMPAFEAAMRFIEQPGEDVYDGIAGYDVLLAAADVDDAVRRAVADFCAAQLQLEAARNKSEDGDLAVPCCQVLVFLKDARVRPFLEREAPDSPDLAELLDHLNDGTAPEVSTQWRKPWKEVCPEWQKELDQEMEKSSGEDVDDEDGLLEDPEIVAKLEEFGRLVEEFNSSPHAVGPMSHPEAQADDLPVLYRYGVQAVSYDFEFPDESDLREYLYEFLPRELLLQTDQILRLIDLLTAFFTFLHATDRLDNAEPLQRLLRRAADDVPRLNKDRNNWGMDKTIRIIAVSNGFDIDTEEGSEAFSKFFADRVAKIVPELAPAPEEPEEFERNHEPFRRTAPKVGRNDPCPCGSGKKFKKCCGKS